MDQISTLIIIEDLLIYFGAWGLLYILMEAFHINSFSQRLMFYIACLIVGIMLIWIRN